MLRKRRAPGFTVVECAIVTALLAFLIAFAIPGPRSHGFIERVSVDESGKEMKYVVFVPWDYHGEKAYPVIFFMHGAGDHYRVTEVGLGKAIRKKEKSFPFFAVFPRIKQPWDADTDESRRSVKILEQVKTEYMIDEKRTYLTGLSNGGRGTWYQAAKYPDLWAGIVPIAGRAVPEVVPQIKHLPCWCFHGDYDKSAPIEDAHLMMDLLRKAGSKPRYTEFDGYAHNVWDRAYGNPALYEWLLEQRQP